MKFVVDTNIVFSGLLNASGKIGRLLLTSKQHFSFYTCEFLHHELLKHQQKLLLLTKLSQHELQELQQLVTQNILFINEALIPADVLLEAEKLTVDVDPNDTVFVGLTDHLNAKLWTGDKELTNGLRAKGYGNIITTHELFQLFEELEKNR